MFGYVSNWVIYMDLHSLLAVLKLRTIVVSTAKFWAILLSDKLYPDPRVEWT